MKKITLLVLGTCVSAILFAQASRTITNTAGNLSKLIPSTERSAITELTILGEVDLSDLSLLNSSFPNMVTLNMENATCNKDTLPNYTMGSTNKVLKSLSMPSNIIAFESYCLKDLIALKHLKLPRKLKSMDSYCCNALDSLETVDLGDSLVSTSGYVFNSCKRLKEVHFPNSFQTLGGYNFNTSDSLQVVEFGTGFKSSSGFCFYECSNIKKIISNSATPGTLESFNFQNTSTSKCTLYVPDGTQKLYDAAYIWTYFISITEMTLRVSTSTLNATTEVSSFPITVTSNIAWVVSSNASWMSTSVTNGNNNASFTITVDENTQAATRTATITVSGGGTTRIISLSQAGVPVTLDATPSNLTFEANPLQSQSIQISSNSSWTVSDTTNWLALSANSGTKNATITIKPSPNTATTPRTATLTITANDVTKTISVTQAGATKVDAPIEDVAFLSLYPNPSSDYISVSTKDVAQISIYTINGNVVLESSIEPQQKLSIQHLKSGNYIVVTKTAGSVQTNRFIKY